MSTEIEIKIGPTVCKGVAKAIRAATATIPEEASKGRDRNVHMASIQLEALAAFLASGEECWPDVHPFADSNAPVVVFKMLVRALVQAGRDGRDPGPALDAIVRREQGLPNVNRDTAAAIALDRDRLLAIRAAMSRGQHRGKKLPRALLAQANNAAQ